MSNTKQYIVVFGRCKDCPIRGPCDDYQSGGIPDYCPFPNNYVHEV